MVGPQCVFNGLKWEKKIKSEKLGEKILFLKTNVIQGEFSI